MLKKKEDVDTNSQMDRQKNLEDKRQKEIKSLPIGKLEQEAKKDFEDRDKDTR
jgi:hypothetical protein